MSDERGHGRRTFLRCMAWAGTGVVWTLEGGLLRSRALADEQAPPLARDAFRFVQISDTHVGFKGEANPEAMASFGQAIARIREVAPAPALLLHTGDLSHAQKAGAFDLVAERLKEVRAGETFFTPGEHDVFVDGGKEFFARFGRGTTGQGWRSFDLAGVHFVGLVNVLSYKGEGLGILGADQLAWLRGDLEGVAASTPVVVYAHVPLWSVYPAWGWTTADGEQALALLRRFGSVTVLNGHIHQILQKVEGQITFHTAASTAFPQPAPGTAPAPGPMKVPAERLGKVLGVRTVTYVPRTGPLAVVDHPLVR
ncbi:metallophosphoesterase family protein [Anaeromyxobacter oryzae]|uniref:Metallophosphoesterase n=1 Tax=Anaeromyxobacter oryzae TaxID=2918170 RepID=A0ABM7WPK7_9BACT|nr:metallophosphoesterase [Anaeromyxobacter oryzae]BDG01388.1 metallophosphoesterase [Anaeromyxobacter oryzae]